MKTIPFSRTVPVTGEYDFFVAGGGLSGIASAWNAAREGLRVCLIEQYSKLGGVPSSGLLGIISGFRLEHERCADGPFLRELLDRARGCGALREADGWNYRFHCERLALILTEMCSDAGIELRLNTMLADAVVSDGRISHVAVATRRGLEAIHASFFADDTGDGNLAVFAGAPFVYGRESDGKVQSSSLTFKLAGIDMARIPENMTEMTRIWRSEPHHVPTDHTVVTYLPDTNGEAAVNMTHILDCDPMTDEGILRIRLEGMRQAYEIAEFFRTRVPGFEHCYVAETAMLPGIRESRRILGDYVLTEQDVLQGRDFPDQIARGCWGIDVHNPIGTHSGKFNPHFLIPRSYGIPYRCIVPKGIKNLYIAGRPISTTHQAFASTRINASCIALGEAIDMALPMAAAAGDVHTVNVDALRKKLQQEGCITDFTAVE